ncbi:MAG: hypothetical protein EA368_04330 [Leptolyngbya sp. DLM2.Bin27]|nr:MAG: hypothetical protein EA368_04330 [Leptolyngbya sp. DLM2.Bin27]
MHNPKAELQPEYRFDYQKAKPNRFAARNDVEKPKVVVLEGDVAQVSTTPAADNKALPKKGANP